MTARNPGVIIVQIGTPVVHRPDPDSPRDFCVCGGTIVCFEDRDEPGYGCEVENIVSPRFA